MERILYNQCTSVKLNATKKKILLKSIAPTSIFPQQLHMRERHHFEFCIPLDGFVVASFGEWQVKTDFY